MPVSEKKLAANRANAKKSTGPRTPQGKAVSSQNATSHGLYAKAAVILSPNLKENPAKYNSLLLGLIEELEPEGPFEFGLVETIANCLWRQRRAMRAETAYTTERLKDLDSKHRKDILNPLFREPDPELTEDDRAFIDRLAQKAAAESLPAGRFSDELLRYELRNNLNLIRAYRLLRDLQRQRGPATEQNNVT